MFTEQLLFDLFCANVEKISAENGLTDKEAEQIIAVFRHALANPYMDDRQIYEKLTGGAPLS